MNNFLASLKDNAEPSLEECIHYLGHDIEWLHEFKQTPQDTEWHAEGDVHIHTNMVLDALYTLLRTEAKHISGWRRQALILGTLLHDIGKPRCTKEMEIKGVMRTASPQHESVGRSYLAYKLMNYDLDFKVIWNVLNLVGEHHMPKLLVVKNMTKGDYLGLSRRVDLELLYWLEVADMKGRICPDLSQQLTHLEEFRLFCQEYGVWESPNDVDSDLAIQHESVMAQNYIYAHALHWLRHDMISMPEEAVAKSFLHKDNHPNLVVLCGPSGIGKSSWVKQHCVGYKLISLDDIREELNGSRTNQADRGTIINLAKKRLKELLAEKQNIVWDATNLRSDFRKIICDFGRAYHALVKLVVFLSPQKEIFKGNKNRQYPVPTDVLQKQLDSFQFPLVDEAHQFIVVGPNGKTLMKSGFFNLASEETVIRG